MAPEFKIISADGGLKITTELPELDSKQLEIAFGPGKILRVVSKQSDGHGPFEGEIDLPPGYDEPNARASYADGQLRIVIPSLKQAR